MKTYENLAGDNPNNFRYQNIILSFFIPISTGKKRYTNFGQNGGEI